MAEKLGDADENGRSECQKLLLGLKRTVEGLLATHSTNIWSMYGGLSRLCVAVEAILTHRLKVYHYRNDLGCVPDYWPFIQGLKWLQPTSGPFIDRLHRMTQTTDQLGKGPVWVRESLQTHTLSTQLKILTMNYAHVSQFYQEDAFLCNRDFFQAMHLCLQAVELNKVSLLTEIDLTLITCHRRVSHVRSASLPINHLAPLDIMGRRKSSSHDIKALAPSFSSPKSECILGPSLELACPENADATQSECFSAKEALISVLERSGGTSPSLSSSPLLETNFSLMGKMSSDPLIGVEVLSSIEQKSKRLKSKTWNFSEGHIYSFRDQKLNKSKSRWKTQSSSETFEESISRSPDSGLMATSPENLLDDILNYENDTFHEEIASNSRLPLSKKSAFSPVIKGDNLENISQNEQNGRSQLSHRRVKSDLGIKSSSSAMSGHRKNSNNSCDDNHSNQSDSNLVNQSNCSSSIPKTKRSYQQSQQWQEDEAGPSSFFTNSDSYFPKPTQGQSLMSYLSSQDFHTCANIDKENAHFSISEALIAAIEQMKWNHVITPPSDHQDGDSDEEIQELKQRIRIRRRERLTEKTKGYILLSDGTTDTTSSSSPPPSQCESVERSDDSESGEDEVNDEEIELSLADTQPSNLRALKDSGLSLSLASLYSDADLVKNTNNIMERQSSILESNGSYVSAESVAISLLKKFSEKHLPKASDLEWLVSEQDAPQALLPLPDSYPISPDDGENSDLLRTTKRPRIRGNLEWAPPRAQIIFNIHPTKKRNVVLSKQNDRCAGCGMKVEPGYVKRFRYCEYLGKYFCQCCHTNSLCYIPARILHKWDFTKYSVSNFSKDLLTKLFDNPLFSLDDINPGLYRKVGSLAGTRDLRTQLHHLLNILRICKTATSISGELERLPGHWTDESHLYSVADLLKVKSGEMQHLLRDYYLQATAHITDCPFCLGMGFICEFCGNAKDVIFPYQLHKVTKCPGCKACYHKTCFQPEKCPKCARLEARRQRLLMVTPSPEHERQPSSFLDEDTETASLHGDAHQDKTRNDDS